MNSAYPRFTQFTMPAHMLATSLVLACLLNTTPRACADDARLVRVLVTQQSHDPVYPWRTRRPSVRAGYGYQIDQNHVLTTEHLTRNHTLVEIQRPRAATKQAVEVLKSDPRLNLTLLRLPVLPTANPLPSTETADHVRLGNDLQILQMDDARDTETGPSRVQQIGVKRLPDAPTSLLVYKLLCNLNVNGEGAPVMQGERLAGMIIAFNPNSRIATMVSAPFVDRFIEDATHPPYRGLASAGFKWQALIDPVKRRYLNIKNDNGVLVLGAVPATSAGRLLKRSDTILEWDGHAVDKLGFYHDPAYGRVEFSHLIKAYRNPGDTVRATMVRDGEVAEIELTLNGELDDAVLVPENIAGERAEYIVAGGFILRELDADYLRAHGSKWRAKVDTQLLNHYLSGMADMQAPTDRIVFVSAMLADEINEGYDNHRNDILTAVNGRPIRNIDDVFQILSDDGHIHRLSFRSDGIDVVFDPAQIDAANARIAQQYRVSAPSYRRP
jgi:hypothetical protein